MHDQIPTRPKSLMLEAEEIYFKLYLIGKTYFDFSKVEILSSRIEIYLLLWGSLLIFSG